MKRNKSQQNKYKTETSGFFLDKQIIRNSSYYTKLYSTSQFRNDDKKLLTNSIFHNKTANQSILNANEKSIFLKKVFNNKIKIRNQKIKWPKITTSKWPFSPKNKPGHQELKKITISKSKPSYKYHNFSTIKWLGQKYSDSVKEKSIYSLLPNNGKPIRPEYESEFNKRHREMMEYLESFRGPDGREKYVNINPKYFYDKTTFKKILKLRDMFLEFDKKGNHKMIIKEIVKLFKQNNINVDVKDIKELFFKNKNNKNKKDEPNSFMYLNFYQFMKFGLTRDQDFRQFMRKVKSKNKYEENKKKNKTIDYNSDNENFDNNEKKTNIYIPMNFNLIFNYFINKEKQRNSFIIVENAIKEMDKIIQGVDESDNSKTKSPKKKKRDSIKVLAPSKSLKDRNLKSLKLKRFEKKKLTDKKGFNFFNSKSSEKFDPKFKDMININNDNNDDKYDINFSELMKEFSNIFDIKDINEEKDSSEEKNYFKSSNSAKSFIIKHNNSNSNSFNGKNENKDKQEKSFMDIMSNNNNKINSLNKLNANNFEKYHNLKMAIIETKEKIKKNRNLHNLNNDDLKVHNLLDIKDIIKNGNHIISPKESQFKKPIIMENLENSSYKDNNSFNNNFDSKTIKIGNKIDFKSKKFQINKKPLYNFYCGMPQILNLDNDNTKSLKLLEKKYDYVPNEFLTIKK